jgi:predicted AAA+ superfamily ATPase
MTFIKRNIYPELQRHVKETPATVITGMRRVGKSTILKELLDKVPGNNKIYLDLERVENRQVFRQPTYDDMRLFLETRGINVVKNCTIALDEIQLLPEIVSVIKYWYDTYRVKFIVTGSSSFYLKNRFSESLAGRKKIFELNPLSFDEYLRFQGFEEATFRKFGFKKFFEGFYLQFKRQYIDYVHHGGFPEVSLMTKQKSKISMLQDILNAYIELDVKLLSDYSLNDELYKLIRLLAARVGSRMDVSKVSSVAGINRNKLTNYLNLFEQTYFMVKLSPFTKNVDKEISQQSKYYFTDSGLLNLVEKQQLGKLFENAVINQFKRLAEPVNFYQRKSGQEIDLIWREKEAIEIKVTPSLSDSNSLKARAKSLALKKHLLVGYSPGKFDDFVWGGNIF